MHCAQKTAKKGKKRRFFILLGFLKIEYGRVNRPPLYFWVHNILLHGKTECLIFLSQ